MDITANGMMIPYVSAEMKRPMSEQRLLSKVRAGTRGVHAGLSWVTLPGQRQRDYAVL
jgi:hypothetical protein